MFGRTTHYRNSVEAYHYLKIDTFIISIISYVSASFNSTIAKKEKDYRIAKDLVFILKTLKNKYSELD
jgi:hypothetical protein